MSEEELTRDEPVEPQGPQGPAEGPAVDLDPAGAASGPGADSGPSGAAERAASAREPGGDATASSARRIADLEAQLADRERQVHRLAADFDNFRRRAAAEKEELVSFAASRVLESFLGIVDNLERALAHAQSGEPASIVQGVELIYKQIGEFLTRHGVAPMESVGQLFDPNLHEAIASVTTTEHPDHTVLAIAQKGYFLNGRVLRHAMVQVADNPSSPQQATTDDTSASKEESHG